MSSARGFALLATALVALAACQSAIAPSGLSEKAAAGPQAHRLNATVSTKLIFYNAYAKTADRVSVTSNGCSWTLAESAPTEIPAAGHTEPIALTYVRSCAPALPEPVWSVSYGLNTGNLAAACSFHVSFNVGRPASYFTYGVTNGVETACTMYDSSTGFVLKYQYRGPGG